MVVRYGGSKVEKEKSLNSSKRVLKQAREESIKDNILPHEWLLRVMLGKPVKQCKYQITYNAQGNEIHRELIEEDYYADFETRFEAAKAAAPFFAPKHSFVQSRIDSKSEADQVIEALKDIAGKLPV